MPNIQDEEDFNRYQEIFGDLWNSGTMRLSMINIGEHWIPNGEIIFHRETREAESNVLYETEDFKIYQETVPDPFTVVSRLFDNDLDIEHGQIECTFSHHRGASTIFQDGHDTRVFQGRPQGELNTAFSVDIPNEELYDETRKVVDKRLKIADEPYYDLAKCEYYYFDHHFRGSSPADPKIMMFADTAMQVEIDEDDVLELIFPTVMTDKISVCTYPMRPYGEYKGRKTSMADADVMVEEGMATYSQELELNEIQNILIWVYAEDRSIVATEHQNTEIPSTNVRHRIIDKYDQPDYFGGYLRTGDSDLFEVAVLNLLGISGYITQWFGHNDFNIPEGSPDIDAPAYDEIDIIAHAPDGSHILFVECTVKRISDKLSLLDKVQEIAAEVIEPGAIHVDPEPRWGVRLVPVVATSQSPGEISPEVVNEHEDRDISILNSEQLITLYRESADESNLTWSTEDMGFRMDDW